MSGISLYISSNGTIASPEIELQYNLDGWYTLRSVVNGTKVTIYINGTFVHEVEMQGEGADSATDNYVGLWCPHSMFEVGEGFMIKGRMRRVQSTLSQPSKRNRTNEVVRIDSIISFHLSKL